MFVCVVSGTSASSPVMAGMVSLVNSARRASGRSTLGWLNPALYQMYTSFTNDITSGNNKCLVNGYGCCAQGFYATDDWDPVSGLGSINFELFKAAMLGINPNPDVDSDESTDKEWLLINGYGSQECSSEGDLTSQSGYPVDVCLVEYDNFSTPVSSAKYACNSAIGKLLLLVDYTSI
jgi:subtilase family serine protease